MYTELFAESACVLAHRQGARGSWRRAVLAVALELSATSTMPSFAAAAALQCKLEAPAQMPTGQAVILRFTLTNLGSVPLQVLKWNTPLEGWFGSYVRVQHAGAELPYRGPRFKRGDPSLDAYVRLDAHQSLSAEVDLALPFDLNLPGRYHIDSHLVLFDVVIDKLGVVPRPRDRFVAQALTCNTVDIRITPASTPKSSGSS
jgi:hypothetical protein